MAPAFRRQRKSGRRCRHHLARITIKAIAGHSGKTLDIRLAIQPGGKEGTDDRIADGELANTIANGHHLTGAIGHGNAWLIKRRSSTDHKKIMVVEGIGLQPYGYFSGAGCIRIMVTDSNLAVTTTGLYIDRVISHNTSHPFKS